MARNEPLPAPCSECAGFNGFWKETPNGFRRCDCPRGQALNALDHPPPKKDTPVAPRLSAAAIAQAAKALAAMDFYPTETNDEARTMIAAEIGQMCSTPAEAQWLVRQMLRLYRKWPGPREMRILFCQEFRPLDGMDFLNEESSVYPDGIPLESKPQPHPLMIGPSDTLEPVEPDAELLAAFARALERSRKMERPRLTLVPSNRPPITQADIDRAVQEHRQKLAEREFNPEPPDAA